MMYPKLHVSGINRGRNLRLTFSCATPVCLQPPRATDPCVPSSRAWSHWTKWKGSGWSRVWPHAEIVTAFPQPDPTNTDSVRTTWSTSGIIVPIRRGHNVPYILICTYYLIAFCMIYFSVLSPPAPQSKLSSTESTECPFVPSQVPARRPDISVQVCHWIHWQE